MQKSGMVNQIFDYFCPPPVLFLPTSTPDSHWSGTERCLAFRLQHISSCVLSPIVEANQSRISALRRLRTSLSECKLKVYLGTGTNYTRGAGIARRVRSDILHTTHSTRAR